MIEFVNVSKHYLTPTRRKVILDRMTLTLPYGAKVGVLGRNGAGKSTLLGMVAGVVQPNSGEIRRHGAMSWPLGFGGSFHPHPDRRPERAVRRAHLWHGYRFPRRLRGRIRRTGRVHGHARTLVFLGHEGAARLRHGDGMSFDWYFVDEITAVGDAAFRRKSLEVFKNRLSGAGLMMVSHSIGTIRSYCTSGLVLEDGRATYFENVRDAIACHKRNMRAHVPT